MPKKRPINSRDVPHLKKVVHEGFSSLLIVRSILSNHFRLDERPIKRIERFVQDYKQFAKECEDEIARKLEN